MPGHPDGQNYAIWRGPDFFANATVHIDSTHGVSVSGQVTNYASIHLNVVSGTNPGLTVNLQYWLDAGLTINLASQSWIVPTALGLFKILPVLGNYVSLHITTTDPVGGACQVGLYPTNVQVPGPTNQATGLLIGSTSVTVLAGASILVPFPVIAAGHYHLFARDINSSTHLSFFVNTLDINGASQYGVVSLPAPVTQQSADFVMDDIPLLLTISNSDVSNRNAAYSLACLSKVA